MPYRLRYRMAYDHTLLPCGPTTHLILSADELTERLVALIPRPHKDLFLCTGVLAPNAKLRARVCFIDPKGRLWLLSSPKVMMWIDDQPVRLDHILDDLVEPFLTAALELRHARDVGAVMQCVTATSRRLTPELPRVADRWLDPSAAPHSAFAFQS